MSNRKLSPQMVHQIRSSSYHGRTVREIQERSLATYSLKVSRATLSRILSYRAWAWLSPWTAYYQNGYQKLFPDMKQAWVIHYQRYSPKRVMLRQRRHWRRILEHFEAYEKHQEQLSLPELNFKSMAARFYHRSQNFIKNPERLEDATIQAAGDDVIERQMSAKLLKDFSDEDLLGV